MGHSLTRRTTVVTEGSGANLLGPQKNHEKKMTA